MKRLLLIILTASILVPAFFVNGAICAEYPDLTEDEKLLIYKAVHSEAENEPYITKIALTAVIINRLPDNGFPDNIHDIITDEGAFPNLENEKLSKLELSDLYEEKLALDCVLIDHIDPTCGSVFFMKSNDSHLWEIHESFRVGDYVFGKPKKTL